MQNSDGGFPAFTHEINENNWLIRAAAHYSKIDNSAEIFDPSCADITGHLLEAIGFLNLTQDTMIAPAIEYLKSTQWYFLLQF
jgi:squalene-hopene/tetraprenyl-beta-curcumene cyclase